MQSAGVVDLFDEAWKPGDHVGMSSIVIPSHLIVFMKHSALPLS